jgi:hypothetical protein
VVETLIGGAYLQELGNWRCVLGGYIGTFVPFSFLATMTWAILLQHSLPLWSSSSSMTQKQWSWLTMNWNLWNCEPKWISHPFALFILGILPQLQKAKILGNLEIHMVGRYSIPTVRNSRYGVWQSVFCQVLLVILMHTRLENGSVWINIYAMYLDMANVRLLAYQMG